MAHPSILAGALRWYHAMPPDISIGGRAGAITAPTTYVWSTDDAAIGRRAAQLTSRWVKGEVLEGVSHRIPEQVPDKLAAHILERIRSVSPATQPARRRGRQAQYGHAARSSMPFAGAHQVDGRCAALPSEDPA